MGVISHFSGDFAGKVKILNSQFLDQFKFLTQMVSYFSRFIKEYQNSIFQFSSLTFQSALFNFQSLLTIVILLICTCTYIRAFAPSFLDRYKTGQAKTYKSNLTQTNQHAPGFVCCQAQGHLLEVCQNRRAQEPLRVCVLYCHGYDFTLLELANKLN